MRVHTLKRGPGEPLRLKRSALLGALFRVWTRGTGARLPRGSRHGSLPLAPRQHTNRAINRRGIVEHAHRELEPPRRLHWLLTQLPGHAGRALDAGCGSGRHTQALAGRFDEVIGVDISAALIDIARHHSGPRVRYVVSDLMAFADPDGFDLVFSSTTLHHVQDLDAATTKIKRAGGEIVLPRVDVPGMGSFFWFRVPGGPIMACWQDAPAATPEED